MKSCWKRYVHVDRWLYCWRWSSDRKPVLVTSTSSPSSGTESLGHVNMTSPASYRIHVEECSTKCYCQNSKSNSVVIVSLRVPLKSLSGSLSLVCRVWCESVRLLIFPRSTDTDTRDPRFSGMLSLHTIRQDFRRNVLKLFTAGELRLTLFGEATCEDGDLSLDWTRVSSSTDPCRQLLKMTPKNAADDSILFSLTCCLQGELRKHHQNRPNFERPRSTNLWVLTSQKHANGDPRRFVCDNFRAQSEDLGLS